MYIHEEVALGMVKERMADAIRFAEQRDARRRASAPRSMRMRLGEFLVRLGRRLLDQPAPALSR